jgi:hypothetical protein
MGMEEPGDSHAIINEWRFLSQVKAIPKPEHGRSEMQYFLWVPTFPQL